MSLASQTAAVIPCFNEERHIGPLVASVRELLPAVVVVDDGSADETARFAGTAGALVVRHAVNQGKGAALRTGLRRARTAGFEAAVLMDGDGQHAPADIPELLAALERTPAALVVGNRMADPAGMPWLRRMVNRWMSRRLSRLAGRDLPDTQCGFRALRLAAWEGVSLRTERFEIESEMLLAFLAAGLRVEFVPVRTIYKREQTKIQPLRDTLRWFRWFRQARRAFRAGHGLPPERCSVNRHES